jgi:hypothetical protein
MEVKLFEVRDRATFIPVLAIRLSADRGVDRWLLARAGYGRSPENYVLLSRLRGGEINYDTYEWGDRTMATAHRFISENWQSLESGDVVDVEFILGETQKRKTSERALSERALEEA